MPTVNLSVIGLVCEPLDHAAGCRLVSVSLLISSHLLLSLFRFFFWLHAGAMFRFRDVILVIRLAAR